MLLAISMIAGILVMAVPSEKAAYPVLQAEKTMATETVPAATELSELALSEKEISEVTFEVPEEPSADKAAVSPSTLTIAGAAEMTADGTENYRLYAEEGDTISFGPSVLEEGEFTYRWQKWDGESYRDISLAENATAESAELTVAVAAGDLDREGTYRCVISCGNVSADAVFTITGDIPTCDTMDELIELVREQMVNRAKYYTVILTSGELIDNSLTATSVAMTNEINDRIYEHTGIPSEGDYLENHSKSVWCSEAVEVENGIKYLFGMSYYTTAAQEELINDIIRDLKSELHGKTSYDTVVNIFRYIIKNVTYDHYHLENMYDYYNYPIRQTAYGALVDGTCVCEGYAVLFYRLALEFGCDSRVISGLAFGSEPHAWNIVDPDGNGLYYLLDATNVIFLVGENYNQGTLSPDSEYCTEEFFARFPLSGEHYKCDVAREYDEETETLTIYEDIPHFYEDFNNNTAPWTNSEKSAKKIVFSDGVEQIGSLAFARFSSLETVEMADSVITLGDKVFQHCVKLERITLSENLQTIGSYCFYNTGSQTDDVFELTLPDSVVNIEEYAFYASGLRKINISESSNLAYMGDSAFSSCELSKIYFPATIRKIGTSAFYGCDSLETVQFAEDCSIISIGTGAFQFCMALKNIKIPESVQNIGDYAFYQCNQLEELVLSTNVDFIGESSFESCGGITAVDFPENLRYIGDRAFFGCKISNVHIPEGVEYIGDGVFSHNYIEQITLDTNNEAFILEDDVLLTRDMERLVIFPNGSDMSSYEIPDGVKTVAEGAFFASQLQSVVLPDTLTEINDTAFSNCRQLETIIIPEGVREIGYATFSSCWKLREIEIPGSVHTIGKYAFEGCKVLETACLHDGVRKLDHNVFSSCSKLETIQLPASVIFLGQNVFGDTTRKVILYSGTAGDWNRIDDRSYGKYNNIVVFALADEESAESQTVFFDGNGHSGSWESKTVVIGNLYGELPEPTREGHTFYGWFTSPTGGLKIDPESIATIDRDHTLYAHWEDTVSASGTVDGMKWFLHNNGELVVWANGNMPHFTKSTMPWSELQDEIKAITVCEGVTQIGNYAFYGCTNAEMLTLPHGLEIIGDYAFRNCISLKRLEIPHGVTRIGEDAFSGCSALSEIILPGSLDTIGELAFRFCTSLTSIDLPESITRIDALAFAYCEKLESITIPAGIGSMGYNIFYNCTSLKRATVTGTNIALGNGLFKECTALTEVILPDGLPGIGIDTFKNCTALETIRIPDSVTHIGQYAFAECENLKNIELGENLELIDKNAFSGCTSLQTVVLPDGLQVIDTLAFANCTGLTEIELNEGLRELGHGVFSGCTGLTEVQIPNNIVSVGVRMFMDCTGLQKVIYAPHYDEIPRGTFANCIKLEEIHIYSDLGLIDERAFSGCSMLSNVYWYHTQQDWDNIRIADNNDALMGAELACLGAAEFDVILNSNGGTSEVNTIQVSYGMPYGELPVPVREGYRFRGWFTELDGGKEVASYTRVSNPLTHTLYARWWAVETEGNCGSNLTWRIFGDGTLEISGSGPMQKFTTAPWADVQDQIHSIIICDGVTSICDNAFESLYGLTDISVASSVASIGQKAFQNCTALQEVKLPEGVVSVGNYAFTQCERLVSVEMPSTCTELGQYIFMECSAMKTAKVFNTGSYMFFFCDRLTDVTIGESVTEIADNAFSYCRALQTINLPQSVTKIGDSAFDSSGLKEITLPETLTTIGESAFRFCGELTSISFPDSVTEIGDYAVANSDRLERVELSENCTYIPKDMFWGCNLLTEIRIPECVDMIGDYAFSGCTGLTTITMSNVKTVGAYAFSVCDGLVRITLPATVEDIHDSAFYMCGGLKEVVFCGGAVTIHPNPYTGCDDVFKNVVATVYYPDNAESWTEDVRRDYGGTLTWMPWYTLGDNPECVHTLTSEQVAVSCKENYTLHSCECGYSYRTDFMEMHTFDDVVTKPTCAEQGYTTKTCTACGYSYQDSFVEPIGHSPVTDAAIEATCTATGLSEGSHCSVCGEVLVEQEIVPATGHTAVVDKAVAPTCTETGYTEGSHCSVCNEVLVAQETVAAKGHKSVTDAAVEATCTETGLTEGAHCSVCNEILTKQETVPAKGHKWDSGIITLEPTEQATGILTYTCEHCGETRTEIIPVLEHVHAYTAVITEPTCTQRGYTTHTCICGESYVDAFVDALGHRVVIDEATEAGCTEAGLTEGSHCVRCLLTLVEQQIVPAQGHQWDEGVVTAEPTEQSTGIRIYTCERCSATKTEVIPALEHVHAYSGMITAPTCTEQGYTTFTCTCGESYIDAFVDALGHNEAVDFGEVASCTESGMTDGSHCSTCGQTLIKQEEIPALGHLWDEGTIILDPTEESTGIIEYICERCGAGEEVEIPALDHVHEYVSVTTDPTCTEQGYTTYTCRCGDSYVDDILDATGHNVVTDTAVDEDCTNSGLTEGSHCVACGMVFVSQEIVPALGHQWNNGEETVAPTEYANGIMTYICQRCGETKEETIPALEHVHGYDAVITDPTCTEQGYTTYTCRCGDSYVDDLVDALDHQWDIGIVTLEPAEETSGIRTYTCERCEIQREETIPVLDHVHSYDAIVTDPTCTEPGYTTYTCRCGDSYTDDILKALGHTEVVDTAVAANCTATGLTEGKHCSVCNEILVAQEVVPVNGHSFEMQENQIRCFLCGEHLMIGMTQDYAVLNVGASVELEVSPTEFVDQIKWTVDGDEGIIAMNGNVVTAIAPGTVHVNAAVIVGEFECAVRFRVDVVDAIRIEGVQLGSNKVTTELYKNEFTTFEILLQLPQNYATLASVGAQNILNNGIAIESAQFTDAAMAKYFDLILMDDRTVQIVPTEEALANVKSVKGSYAGTVTVTVDGQTYETEKLTLTVKKSVPKLKATIAEFNSFYAGQSNPIVITGGTVTEIRENEAKNTAKTTAIPNWVTLADGVLTLNENAPAKSCSGNVYIEVLTEEWRIPVELTLSVKNNYKVPGVKLAVNSIAVANQTGGASVQLQLLCTNKTDVISDIGITSITASEGYTVENFNEADGTFDLTAAEGFKAGKVDLTVRFGERSIVLKLTVKTEIVKLKLSASKVTLNKDLGDVGSVDVTWTSKGYTVTEPVLTYDAQMLDVQYVNGKLSVTAKDAAAYGKTYVVSIAAYEGAPAVKLNVAILKQNAVVKSTIKATGTLDVIRQSTAITVAPTYTNVLNVDVDRDAVLKIYSSADKFKEAIAEVRAENGVFTIDSSVICDHSLKYKAQLETVIGENTILSGMISLNVKMGTAKLTVVAKNATLFSKDKHDRALFWFETTDATLNSVARVEFKDAKQAAMFELIDHGDGTYAIGFKDGKVDTKLVGKSVTVNLNVFIEGNETTKANAAVAVKLTIAK